MEESSGDGGKIDNIKETLRGYKETFTNVEEMMRRMLHSQKDKNLESSSTEAPRIDMESSGLLSGKGMKVDVPRFSDTDAKDWVFKIKEFFDIYGIPTEQRIKIVSFHMDGLVYAWYKWIVKNSLVQNWVEFLKALLLRFGSTLYDDPKATLKELKQTRSVVEYQTQFKEISTRVTGLSEQRFLRPSR